MVRNKEGGIRSSVTSRYVEGGGQNGKFFHKEFLNNPHTHIHTHIYIVGGGGWRLEIPLEVNK